MGGLGKPMNSKSTEDSTATRQQMRGQLCKIRRDGEGMSPLCIQIGSHGLLLFVIVSQLQQQEEEIRTILPMFSKQVQEYQDMMESKSCVLPQSSCKWIMCI